MIIYVGTSAPMKLLVGSGDLTTAPLLPGRLRSADAIHLATALRVGARAMVVYDTELSAAAALAGIRVHSPRQGPG